MRFIEFDAFYDWGDGSKNSKYKITAPISALRVKHQLNTVDGRHTYYIYAGGTHCKQEYSGVGKYIVEKAEYERVRRLLLNMGQDTDIEPSEPVESNMEGLEV
jgi:hypothetical protein